jgi:hypothetical protein
VRCSVSVGTKSTPLEIDAEHRTPLEIAVETNNSVFVQMLLDDYLEYCLGQPCTDLSRRPLIREQELVAVLKAFPGRCTPFLKTLPLVETAHLIDASMHCDTSSFDNEHVIRSRSIAILRWKVEIDDIWRASTSRNDRFKTREKDVTWGQPVKAKLVPVVGNELNGSGRTYMPFSELLEQALEVSATDPSLFDAPFVQVWIRCHARMR